MLTPAVLDAVLQRLHLTRPDRPDLGWLQAAYRAWSRGVPFTNLAKLQAIRSGQPLPSLDPADQFAQFLEDGSCGTCFSHALAFRALLAGVGYDAVNYAGHTRGPDGGRGEHATTLVHLDGETLLVDTALPHGEPLPLFRDRPSQIDGVMTPMTATPEGDLWRLDFLVLHDGSRRSAQLTERVRDLAHASACWLRTLEEGASPFNERPVARLEVEGGALTLAGSKLFVTDLAGNVRVEPAGPETLSRFGVRPDAHVALWDRPEAS